MGALRNQNLFQICKKINVCHGKNFEKKQTNCAVLHFTSQYLEKTSKMSSFSRSPNQWVLYISKHARRSSDGPLIFTSVTVWSPWVRKKIIHNARIDNSWCTLSGWVSDPTLGKNDRFLPFRSSRILYISKHAHRSPDGSLIFTNVTVWSPWVRKKIFQYPRFHYFWCTRAQLFDLLGTFTAHAQRKSLAQRFCQAPTAATSRPVYNTVHPK